MDSVELGESAEAKRKTNENTMDFVIAVLVAAIHGSARVNYQENSTPVEPWITGTSPVMTQRRDIARFQLWWYWQRQNRF